MARYEEVAEIIVQGVQEFDNGTGAGNIHKLVNESLPNAMHALELAIHLGRLCDDGSLEKVSAKLDEGSREVIVYKIPEKKTRKKKQKMQEA